jgi:hypothetical protein
MLKSLVTMDCATPIMNGGSSVLVFQPDQPLPKP